MPYTDNEDLVIFSFEKIGEGKFGKPKCYLNINNNFVTTKSSIFDKYDIQLLETKVNNDYSYTLNINIPNTTEDTENKYIINKFVLTLNNFISLRKEDDNGYTLYLNDEKYIHKRNEFSKFNKEIPLIVDNNIQRILLLFKGVGVKTQFKKKSNSFLVNMFSSSITSYFSNPSNSYLYIYKINTTDTNNNYNDIEIRSDAAANNFPLQNVQNIQNAGNKINKSKYKLSKEPKMQTKSGMKSIYVGMRGGKYVKLNNKYVNIKSIKK